MFAGSNILWLSTARLRPRLPHMFASSQHLAQWSGIRTPRSRLSASRSSSYRANCAVDVCNRIYRDLDLWDSHAIEKPTPTTSNTTIVNMFFVHNAFLNYYLLVAFLCYLGLSTSTTGATLLFATTLVTSCTPCTIDSERPHQVRKSLMPSHVHTHTALCAFSPFVTQKRHIHNMVVEPVFLTSLAVETPDELQQHCNSWKLANAALLAELREAQEFGEERYRHDRDAARKEA